jgi:RsiW-degrading membrane proteinase PrsW (M82 family)
MYYDNNRHRNISFSVCFRQALLGMFFSLQGLSKASDFFFEGKTLETGGEGAQSSSINLFWTGCMTIGNYWGRGSK